jgi:GNAT superfamily N-acetyltransferase
MVANPAVGPHEAGFLRAVSGVQSHGRSLLVWPQRLTSESVQVLRVLAPLGVRIVSFELGGLDWVWPGEPARESLWLFVGRTPGIGPSPVGETGSEFSIGLQEVEMVQALHRCCAITPLPADVLVGGEDWTHALHRHGGHILATASLQRLLHPVEPLLAAPSLVCAVGVHPQWRRSGLGRRVVDQVLSRQDGSPAVALVEAGNPQAAAFFQALGWRDSGRLAEVAWWE